jgi:hypothetical protein
MVGDERGGWRSSSRRRLKLWALRGATDALRLLRRLLQSVTEQFDLSDDDGIGWTARAKDLREAEEGREERQRRDER